jgi:hypothetical protein
VFLHVSPLAAHPPAQRAPVACSQVLGIRHNLVPIRIQLRIRLLYFIFFL